MKRILNKQFLEEFKDGDVVIHCETLGQAKRLFKALKVNDIAWYSGKELDEEDTNWKECGEETCYEYDYQGICYAEVDYYYKHEDVNYEIVDFKDLIVFDEENPNIDDLQTGMILVSKNGEISMVLRDTANGDIISGEVWKSFYDLYFYGQRKGCRCSEYDIVEVWQPTSNMYYLSGDKKWGEVELTTEGCIPLYKFETPKKMTVAQIEEELGYKIEIIEE